MLNNQKFVWNIFRFGKNNYIMNLKKIRYLERNRNIILDLLEVLNSSQTNRIYKNYLLVNLAD